MSDSSTTAESSARPSAANVKSLDEEADELFARAESLLSKGQLQEADAAIHAALAKSPKRPRFFALMARICMAQNRLADAKLALEHGINLAPRSPQAHFLLGDFLRKHGDLAKAEEKLRWAIKHDSKVSAFHASLGALLMEQCFYEDAEESLKRAIRLNRRSPQPRISLAELMSQRGEHRSAEKMLRKAHEFAPKSRAALLALCKSLEEQGKIDEAIEFTRTLLSMDPKNTGIHARLSALYRKAGRMTDAEQALREGLAQQRTSALYLGLVNLLIAESRNDQAIEVLSEACDFEPANKSLRTRLAALKAGRAAKGPNAPVMAEEPVLPNELPELHALSEAPEAYSPNSEPYSSISREPRGLLGIISRLFSSRKGTG